MGWDSVAVGSRFKLEGCNQRGIGQSAIEHECGLIPMMPYQQASYKRGELYINDSHLL
jgi:hypothetical protein